MQIVQKLAGYTLGRCRSGAPCHVQEEGRRHAAGAPELCIWKSEAEGVPGCIANGIPEKVANQDL